MLIDTYFESLVGTALLQELIDAGKGVTQNDKAHLQPRLVMTLDNDEPDFWAISHVLENAPHRVWALCCIESMGEPFFADVDTHIFSSWADEQDIPPWDNAYRVYRYQGERTLTQLMDDVDSILEHPPAWLTASRAASDERLAIIDGFELTVAERQVCKSLALLSEEQMQQLMTNWRCNQEFEKDDYPVVKLHLPAIRAVWLLTMLNPGDGDMAFGLCDLGQGFPELGYVNLSELAALRGPEELRVMQDVDFVADKSLSAYYREASQNNRIIA